jgi:hypothetical protein
VTQDGRPLCRYRRQWKIERLTAWLPWTGRQDWQNYRRVLARYEHVADNYFGWFSPPAL